MSDDWRIREQEARNQQDRRLEEEMRGRALHAEWLARMDEERRLSEERDRRDREERERRQRDEEHRRYQENLRRQAEENRRHYEEQLAKARQDGLPEPPAPPEIRFDDSPRHEAPPGQQSLLKPSQVWKCKQVEDEGKLTPEQIERNRIEREEEIARRKARNARLLRIAAALAVLAGPAWYVATRWLWPYPYDHILPAASARGVLDVYCRKPGPSDGGRAVCTITNIGKTPVTAGSYTFFPSHDRRTAHAVHTFTLPVRNLAPGETIKAEHFPGDRFEGYRALILGRNPYDERITQLFRLHADARRRCGYPPQDAQSAKVQSWLRCAGRSWQEYLALRRQQEDAIAAAQATATDIDRL